MKPAVKFFVHSPDPRERGWTDAEARAAFEAGEAPACSLTGADAWAHLQRFGPTPEMVEASRLVGLYGAPRYTNGRFPDATWAQDPADEGPPLWCRIKRAKDEAAAKATTRNAA